MSVQRRWADEGVEVVVEIAENGSALQPTQRTPYPFQPSSNAPPPGWTAGNNSAGASLGTSAAGVFTYVFGSSGTGIATVYREFPVVIGKRYQISVEFSSQTTTRGQIDVSMSYYPTNVLPPQPGGVTRGFNVVPSDASWHTGIVTLYTAPVQAQSIRVNLGARPQVGVTQSFSASFQNFTLTEISEPSPDDLVWHDVTCDVQRLGIRYGRQKYTDRYDVGTFSVQLLNTSGEYSFQSPHPWNLRPGRAIRARAMHEGVEYPMLYGIIDGLVDDYDFDGRARTTISAYDPTKLLGNTNVREGNEWQVNNFWAGQRVAELLDQVLFPSSYARVDFGEFAMARIAGSGRSLRDEIGLTADSEGGGFYGDRAGNAVFRDRRAAERDPYWSTVQANMLAYPFEGPLPITDDIPTAPGAPSVALRDLQPDWSVSRVVNDVQLAVAGGTMREYTDADSITDYGVQTYRRLDLVCSGQQAGAHPVYGTTYTTDQRLMLRANDIMAGNLDAELRVNRLTWDAQLADVWPFTLGVFLGWRVRVIYANLQRFWGYAVVSRVQSIEHAITPTGWTVQVAIDEPVGFADFDITPAEGLGWDEALWDVDRWDDTPRAAWSKGALWSDPLTSWAP